MCKTETEENGEEEKKKSVFKRLNVFLKQADFPVNRPMARIETVDLIKRGQSAPSASPVSEGIPKICGCLRTVGEGPQTASQEGSTPAICFSRLSQV